MTVKDIKIGQLFFQSIGWRLRPIVMQASSPYDYNAGWRMCVHFNRDTEKTGHWETEPAYTIPYIKEMIKGEFYETIGD